MRAIYISLRPLPPDPLMLSFLSTSKVRALHGRNSVALLAEHYLTYKKPSNSPQTHKCTRVPDNVDVFLASNLVVKLAGTVNRVGVTPQDIIQSQLAQHFVEYMRTNADELGIAMITDAFLGQDGSATLVVTSSRCAPSIPTCRPAHVNLVELRLVYSWKITAIEPGETMSSLNHPFSAHLSLPFRGLLDNVVHRFVKWHLTKRYPLIFGPLRQQLAVEVLCFPSIFRSISNIITRSSDPTFKASCRQLIKVIRQHVKETNLVSTSSLEEWLGSIGLESFPADDITPTTLTDEGVLCFAMESLYRLGMKPVQFKGTAINSIGKDDEDDDNLAKEVAPPATVCPDEAASLLDPFLQPTKYISFDDLCPSFTPTSNDRPANDGAALDFDSAEDSGTDSADSGLCWPSTDQETSPLGFSRSRITGPQKMTLDEHYPLYNDNYDSDSPLNQPDDDLYTNKSTQSPEESISSSRLDLYRMKTGATSKTSRHQSDSYITMQSVYMTDQADNLTSQAKWPMQFKPSLQIWGRQSAAHKGGTLNAPSELPMAREDDCRRQDKYKMELYCDGNSENEDAEPAIRVYPPSLSTTIDGLEPKGDRYIDICDLDDEASQVDIKERFPMLMDLDSDDDDCHRIQRHQVDSDEDLLHGANPESVPDLELLEHQEDSHIDQSPQITRLFSATDDQHQLPGFENTCVGAQAACDVEEIGEILEIADEDMQYLGG